MLGFLWGQVREQSQVLGNVRLPHGWVGAPAVPGPCPAGEASGPGRRLEGAINEVCPRCGLELPVPVGMPCGLTWEFLVSSGQAVC